MLSEFGNDIDEAEDWPKDRPKDWPKDWPGRDIDGTVLAPVTLSVEAEAAVCFDPEMLGELVTGPGPTVRKIAPAGVEPIDAGRRRGGR